jgi:hypothetical protein
MLLHVRAWNGSGIEDIIVTKMPSLQVLMIPDETLIVDPSILLTNTSISRVILDKYHPRWDVLSGSRIVVEGFELWSVYTMPW